MSTAVFEDVASYYRRRHFMHMASLATTTFVLYDIILTLPEEVYYVWRRSSWSLAKITFLLNRYYTPIMFGYQLYTYFALPPSTHFCLIKGYLSAPTSLVPMVLVTMVLIVRTWAILNRSRAILTGLIAGYIALFGGVFAYFFIVTRDGLPLNEVWTLKNIPIVRGALEQDASIPEENYWVLDTCFTVGVPAPLGAVMVASLVYESVLMYLMLRQQRLSRPLSPAMSRFYSDGAAYYILMFLVLVFGTLGCYYNETSRALVASRYFIGFKSMLASRMILRLRWYFSPRCSLQVTDGSTTLHAGAVTDTGIIFAAPEEAITRTFSWDTTDTRRPSPSTNSIALQRIA